jgi:uncharacterized protein YukE
VAGAGGGYEVKADVLQKASTAYEDQGDAIKEALARFEPVANVPDSAFGRLPESAQFASEYHEFLAEVTKDIAKLSQSLVLGGQHLSQTAAEYRRAEHDSTVR